MEEADRLGNYLSNPPAQKSVLRNLKNGNRLWNSTFQIMSSEGICRRKIKRDHQYQAKASALTFVAIKKKAVKRPNIDPDLSKLILWYIGTATF